MKVRVWIWDSLNQEEEEASVVEIDAWTEPLDTLSIQLRDAAEAFMMRRWANSDYVSCMQVNVRTPEGVLVELDVYAEPSVNFRAIPRRTPVVS